jgi:phage shock protein PspC (stress-responsive transcriptional regulator)
MTTTDPYGGYPPPPPPPPPAAAPTGPGGPGAADRVLRRSRDNRVAAGVSGGLGEYFGLDPVLFRVLFATSAFFAGAGILAYLLAWAAIPEAGTNHAMIDNWVGALRRRRFPAWLAAIIAGLVLWAVAFSWWAPRPFVAVIIVAALVVIFFGRRDLRSGAGGPGGPAAMTPPPPPTAPMPTAPMPTAPVAPPTPGDSGQPDAVNEPTQQFTPTPPTPPTAPSQPAWAASTRAWIDESREASRRRRRRAMPVRVITLITLAVALIALAVADAVAGIQIQVYFWVAFGIIALGLLTGLALRRAPLSLIGLLVPAIIGTIAFAGSHASLSDGADSRTWKPTTTLASDYRLGLGQATLDLTALPAPTGPLTTKVTLGAGQVRIVAPRTMNLTVIANIHIGQVEVDGNDVAGHAGHGGVALSRVISPPVGATGPPVTVDVHLADGQVTVDHR